MQQKTSEKVGLDLDLGEKKCEELIRQSVRAENRAIKPSQTPKSKETLDFYL